jgi:flagellar basal-body rod protein FlgF
VKGQEIFVDYQGRVQVDGQLADRLLTVRFRNQDNLQKLGNSFFAPISSDDVPIPSEEVRVQQGMLEGSNVNTVMEMTRMISANRTYESIQKSLSSVDRMNERAISISRLRG